MDRALLIAWLALAAEAPPTCGQPGDDTPCRFYSGTADIEEGGYSCKVYAADAGPDDIYLFPIHYSDPLAHESDPTCQLDPRTIQGRTVRRCITHSGSTAFVVGGMSPRDYAFAVAQEAFTQAAVGDRSVGRVDRAMVRVGLSGDRWATREAAHDVLARRGPGAIGACLMGATDRDAEVRLRCGLILDEVRTGRVNR